MYTNTYARALAVIELIITDYFLYMHIQYIHIVNINYYNLKTLLLLIIINVFTDTQCIYVHRLLFLCVYIL